jgi:hypothetical protein
MINNRFNVVYHLLYECKLKIIQMKKELTEQEKNFNKWLEQFIKDSGHQWGFGFYVETTNGEVFHQGTDEYKEWYNGKLEEYNKTHNF